LNGSDAARPAGTTIAELVAELCLSPKGVAVARNGEIVTRSSWADVTIQDGDVLEIVTAAAGG
jgi:sulfur carrier protein